MAITLSGVHSQLSSSEASSAPQLATLLQRSLSAMQKLLMAQRNSSQFSLDSATSVQTALKPFAPTDLSADMKLEKIRKLISTVSR